MWKEVFTKVAYTETIRIGEIGRIDIVLHTYDLLQLTTTSNDGWLSDSVLAKLKMIFYDIELKDDCMSFGFRRGLYPGEYWSEFTCEGKSSKLHSSRPPHTVEFRVVYGTSLLSDPKLPLILQDGPAVDAGQSFYQLEGTTF